MRLKTLTNCTTALLISACLALGATLWWSRQALQLPHQLMDRYLDLSQRFQSEVADNILAYLAGGDAVRHQSASQALERLDTEVQQLPEALVLALKPSIDSIRAFSAGDLLAAGKLSGDAQGLLLQAEREMAGSMDQLARYAGQSESAAARTYLPLLQAGSQHLLQLTHSRERYITQGLSAPLEELQRQLKALHALSNELNALPLLGVLEEVSRNSLAAELGLETASTEPAEDRGIALKRELASLIQRYPAELERTRTLISARQQLQQSTREQISSLQQALAGLQPLVRHEQQRIQHEVSRLQALVIGVLLLVALSIDRLQRRLSQLLEGLVPPLSAWADGRFTEPVTLNTKTRELCEIERSLNHLRAYLSNLVGSIRQHAEQVAESSQHLAELSDGLHAGAARQVSDTAHIRDALGELEDTIQQVASDASQTAVASHEADRAAVLGQQVISQSLNGLHDLVKQVQDSAQSIEQLATETAAIGQVLTVISGVAQQTNLLALNAAIEAARAGEMGRGFAVVAEEVRSLAMRTTSATHEIQQLIDRLQQAAHQSVASMRSQVDRAAATASRAASADGALDAVVSAIRTIASSALRIAEATAQQGAAASDIRGHSQRIHQLGEDNLGRIGACRQQGAQLQTLGSQLHQAVQAFQV